MLNAVADQPDAAALAGSSKEDVSALKEKLHEVLKTRSFLVTQESHLVNINARLKRDIQNVTLDHRNLILLVDTEKMEAKRY